MTARGRLVCLICAACALALPAAAGAKPGYYVSKPGRFMLMDLRGSNGYGISIISFDSKHVSLLAHKGRMTASYSARGQVTDDSVEADFGARGRVSVRFRPGGPAEEDEIYAGCKGKQGTAKKGRFVGSIRFQGENGFTHVSAEGAHGTVFHSYREVCKRGAHRHHRPHHHKHPTAASLNASERREGMWISRSASASAPPETFAVSPPGTSPFTGTVAPPAPFSGTATYERVAHSTSTWTGDLKVELPGLGRVPLTGPPYAARLCRSLGCACPPHEECFFAVVISGRPDTNWLQRKIARLR